MHGGHAYLPLLAKLFCSNRVFPYSPLVLSVCLPILHHLEDPFYSMAGMSHPVPLAVITRRALEPAYATKKVAVSYINKYYMYYILPGGAENEQAVFPNAAFFSAN
jgi:hypothetical protein